MNEHISDNTMVDRALTNHNYIIIKPRKSIDRLSTHNEIKNTIKEAIEGSERDILVDVSDIRLIDAKLIDVLIECCKSAEASHRSVKVTGLL